MGHPVPPPETWIGSDESGKGDYFGALVICAARATFPVAAIDTARCSRLEISLRQRFWA